MSTQNPTTEIVLTLTPEDLLILNRALIVRPFGEVADLIAKINRQLHVANLPVNPPFKAPYANNTGGEPPAT